MSACFVQNTISLTFLPELSVIRKEVQCKRVVPSIDKFDSFIKIVDGNDGQNRCKEFTRRRTKIRTDSWRARSTIRSLAHQRIIRTNIPDNRGSDVFRVTVGVSTKDGSSLGVVQ